MRKKGVKKHEGDGVPLRPYTVAEIIALYGVDGKTFRKWISPFLATIGKRIGNYYTILQVQTIFEKLGLPGNVMVE